MRGASDPRLTLALVSAALPILLLWFLSPAIAHGLSAPAIPGAVRLTARERAHALRYAVLHWRYFSQFVNEESSWLLKNTGIGIYEDGNVPWRLKISQFMEWIFLKT